MPTQRLNYYLNTTKKRPGHSKGRCGAGIINSSSSSRVSTMYGLKGDNMNRTAGKWTIDAAKYSKADHLDIMPDIPREELFNTVSKHIYYQQKRMSPRTKRMM